MNLQNQVTTINSMSSTSININDFRKEIGGALTDPTTYSFKEIVSTNAHGTKTFYNIIVRLCVESDVKVEDDNGDNPNDKFIPIQDSFFDSSTVLPTVDGKQVVCWIKVLSKIGADGKIKKAPPTYVRSGKNIGKKNQTNAFTQGLRDALSKYNKQLAKADTADVVSNGVKLYPPMLAQVLDAAKITYDPPGTPKAKCYYVQKKLNGVRAVATLGDDGNTIMYSRTRKPYTGFGYIKSELAPILKHFKTEYNLNVHLDGELYKHGTSLQVISGTARNETNTNDSGVVLEYWIYDLFVPEQPTLTQSERFDYLDILFDTFNPTYTKYLSYESVCSKSELDEAYREALNDKYEGVMLRHNSAYVYSYNGYHSSVLLKVKPVLDAEFKIVGYCSGTVGKSEGVLLFELEAVGPDNVAHKFNINLGLPIAERKVLFSRMSQVEANGKTYFENNYLNRYLTVLYDELSTDGVPVRARTEGIVIRDD